MPLSQHVAGIKLRMSVFTKLSLNMTYVVFLLRSIKCRLKEFHIIAVVINISLPF